MLQRLRLVVGIHLDYEICALALCLENLKSSLGVGGSDDSVGDLTLQEGRGLGVALVGERDEISVGGHAVSAAGADICRRHR